MRFINLLKLATLHGVKHGAKTATVIILTGSFVVTGSVVGYNYCKGHNTNTPTTVATTKPTKTTKSLYASTDASNNTTTTPSATTPTSTVTNATPTNNTTVGNTTQTTNTTASNAVAASATTVPTNVSPTQSATSTTPTATATPVVDNTAIIDNQDTNGLTLSTIDINNLDINGVNSFDKLSSDINLSTYFINSGDIVFQIHNHHSDIINMKLSILLYNKDGNVMNTSNSVSIDKNYYQAMFENFLCAVESSNQIMVNTHNKNIVNCKFQIYSIKYKNNYNGIIYDFTRSKSEVLNWINENQKYQ